MSWLKSLITAVCTAGICFGALFIISPTGKTERSVKYVLSLCFLVVIIAVAGVELKMSDFEINFNTDTVIDLKPSNEATAKYVFSSALKNAGIDFKEISVFTDNLENGGISCTKVKIVTDCDRQRVVAALGGEKEGFEVEVINE